MNFIRRHFFLLLGVLSAVAVLTLGRLDVEYDDGALGLVWLLAVQACSYMFAFADSLIDVLTGPTRFPGREAVTLALGIGIYAMMDVAILQFRRLLERLSGASRDGTPP